MKQANVLQKVGLPSMSSRAVGVLFFVGLVLFVLTSYLLWRQVINSPQNVFNGMLENNLRSRSIAKRTVQESGAQTLDQLASLQANQYNTAQSYTTLSQQGDGTSAVVRTESIGTPVSDYVRYVSIETDQQSLDGGEMDFSEALGVWGRSGGTGEEVNGELYGELVFGIVPFGYVEPVKRAELIDYIHENEVYAVDYKNVESANVDGRPQYAYPVAVDAEKYVTMLKQFGEALGLSHLETLDAESFRDSPKFELKIHVDVWSHQLQKIEFVGSGRTETMSSYGSWVPVTLPNIDETISVEELQTRLQSVQ